MKFFKYAGLAFGIALAAQAAEAQDAPKLVETHSTIELISEKPAFEAGKEQWLAVQFTPREHWHTYWINPGDSGEAPKLNWKLPEGVTASAPVFQTPGLMPAGGVLMNYGYEQPSELLVKFSVSDSYTQSQLPIVLDATWLVCESECIPQTGSVSLTLPTANGASNDAGGATTALFAEARAKVPQPSFWPATLTYTASESKLFIEMAADEAERITDVTFFPVSENVTEYIKPQTVSTYENGLVVNMERYKDSGAPANGNGIIVLTDAGGSVVSFELTDVDAVAGDGLAAAGEDAGFVEFGTDDIPLWQAAIFALFGGVILNLMPCVFPVLSLKAMSFVQAGGQTTAERKVEGWAYTGGIFVSFGVLVAILLSLKAGGTAVGWGFQFQEPLFVGAMIYIVILVGLSLSGLFNIQTGFEGAGQSLTTKDGPKGAFFTGVLATLVATPCTAPLMAPAIGYALTQSIPVVILVFGMLAFGLALPFLLLAYVPAIANKMPRPGAWMETFKHALAFPMYGTGVWMLGIFMAQSGADAVSTLLWGLVAVVFAVWLYQQGRTALPKVFALLIVVATVVLVAREIDVPAGEAVVGDVQQVESGNGYFETTDYSPETLQQLINEKKPVFAYFTAKWCITCKLNERVALYRDETAEVFKNNNITVVRGDWTNRNAEIAEVLQRYKRAGVPLYLFFPAGSNKPVVLPATLTTGIIKDVVEGNV